MVFDRGGTTASVKDRNAAAGSSSWDFRRSGDDGPARSALDSSRTMLRLFREHTVLWVGSRYLVSCHLL